MTLSSSIKIISPLVALIFIVSGCESNEPELVPDVIFKLELTENFNRGRFQSVAIISDYSGNVLAMQKLNNIETVELVVPKEDADTYHLTIFDGLASFTTFASLLPSTYKLDHTVTSYQTHVGVYSIYAEGLAVQPSGSDVSFYHNKTNSELELWLTKDSTDLFMYLEPFPFDEARYMYLPVVKKNESIAININSNLHRYNKLPVAIKSSGTNIYLSGDNDLDEMKMSYFLSRSGPLAAGANTMYIPSAYAPKVNYYRTVFSSPDGHNYTSTDTKIATDQKLLATNASSIVASSSSIFYSIESDATIWTGLRSRQLPEFNGEF